MVRRRVQSRALVISCNQSTKKRATQKAKPTGKPKSKGFGYQENGYLIDRDQGNGITVDKLGHESYRAYKRADYLPSRYVDLVAIELPPRSRLVVKEDAILGDLLFISTPVAYLTGAFSEPPEVEDFQVYLLEEGLTPAKRKLLQTLYAAVKTHGDVGEEASSSNASAQGEDQETPLNSNPASSQPGTSSLTSPVDVAAASTQSTPRDDPGTSTSRSTTCPQLELKDFDLSVLASQTGERVPRISGKQLLDILQRCSYSEHFQDPAVMQLRHQTPVGFIGVWPEFALMEHSCVPNTSVCVVKDRMFVHAVEDIPAGFPLTANLVSNFLTTPLHVRREQIRESYGFTCRCPRCQLEEKHQEDVGVLISEIHDKCGTTWVERFRAAVEQEQEEDLDVLQEEILEYVNGLEETLAGLGDVNEEQRTWIKAGVYASYELLYHIEELLHFDNPNLDYLVACLDIVEAVARGTEGHNFLTMTFEQLVGEKCQELLKELQRSDPRRMSRASRAKTMNRVRKWTELGDVAVARYFASLYARYGIISEELAEELKQALQVFHEGLGELGALEGEDDTEEVSRVKEMMINGVKFTVEDRVGPSTLDGAKSSGGSLDQDGLKISVVEDTMAGQGAGRDEEGVEDEDDLVIDLRKVDNVSSDYVVDLQEAKSDQVV